MCNKNTTIFASRVNNALPENPSVSFKKIYVPGIYVHKRRTTKKDKWETEEQRQILIYISSSFAHPGVEGDTG